MKLLHTSKIILAVACFALCVSCKEDIENTTPTENPADTDTAFVQTITFQSLDSLTITADHYHLKMDAPVIVLCHQAGWSRGEYIEIAPKLNALGYNCVAIDQRSGGSINGVMNQTSLAAKAESKPTSYNDSKQDVVAAVAWAKKTYGKNVILWGSSYSSSLALIVAKEDANVEAVMAFSPGEYLLPVNVKTSIAGLNKRAFLTSSNAEQGQTKAIFDVITSTEKTHFVPKGPGEHGSRALWSDKQDNPEYWVAVEAFLEL